ncbi:hypothetical protein DKY63_07375 [Pseudomonas putida]|uniref:Uncharacterized protein n=1 Tax=Pseudomonas putida TaxID=303 RepID=A0A2Z4RF08_PSEPU|nr:hypothetical protein DKY63_07375 [Pseudomonas putida]
MVVNDNAGSLTPRGVPSSIASRLAPTGGAGKKKPSLRTAGKKSTRCMASVLRQPGYRFMTPRRRFVSKPAAR